MATKFFAPGRSYLTGPTSKQAHQLRQKISGGFRSEQGAADFAVIRSLLSTAGTQGSGLLHTLNGDPAQVIASLRSA